MSQTLVACLVAVAINLAGMSVIYGVLSAPMARLASTGRGVLSVIGLTFLAQLFWIVPSLLVIIPHDPDGASIYGLWFGNWIVTGFALVLFRQGAARIPRALHDSARMDGLGAFGSWRQVVFPFVSRELGLLCLFTAMATLLGVWGFITAPNAGNSIVLFQRFLSPSGRLAMMVAFSIVGILPLIAIFFLANRPRPHP
jgi:ABC-type glycerol-3-phosphate transport system permease component